MVVPLKQEQTHTTPGRTHSTETKNTIQYTTEEEEYAYHDRRRGLLTGVCTSLVNSNTSINILLLQRMRGLANRGKECQHCRLERVVELGEEGEEDHEVLYVIHVPYVIPSSNHPVAHKKEIIMALAPAAAGPAAQERGGRT